jgi:hypothetical protein
MDERWLEVYLRELTDELRKRGVYRGRILEEAHTHLIDAMEHELQNGSNRETAQRLAVERFGPASMVAAQFYSERNDTVQKILAAIALISGILIAFVDSRPTWDDTGITVICLLAASGLLGILGPKRPWLWALLVGIWLPLYTIVNAQNFSLLITLIFPFLGAYAGMLVRKLIIDRLIPAG